jgi:hypothetical protein
VVHRSIVDKFIAEQAFLPGKTVGNLTLENLVQNPETDSWISSFGAVGREAKLSAVKALMDGNPKCSDVVVTADGSKSSRAIGWVTNVIVAEKSKA